MRVKAGRPQRKDCIQFIFEIVTSLPVINRDDNGTKRLHDQHKQETCLTGQLNWKNLIDFLRFTEIGAIRPDRGVQSPVVSGPACTGFSKSDLIAGNSATTSTLLVQLRRNHLGKEQRLGKIDHTRTGRRARLPRCRHRHRAVSS
ncbi:hypothetical protein PviCFBP13507_09630 [Pseudomonas viridiflava]|nr:hypothetical protein PviCFBP13507_09630 [Pseudomonas viridiflava]